MTTTAERDDVQEQLCARIDELERDKEVLAAQLDRAEVERDGLNEQLGKSERRAEYESESFRILCHAIQRLEEIVGIDTGGYNGPGPAIGEVERIVRERDALAAHVEELRQRGDSLRSLHPRDAFIGAHARKRVEAWDAARSVTPTTSLARMKDERAQAIQKAVHQARMEWAKEDKAELDRLKAEWQAEAMEAMAARLWPVGMIGKGEERTALLLRASELRRQAEGGDHAD